MRLLLTVALGAGMIGCVSAPPGPSFAQIVTRIIEEGRAECAAKKHRNRTEQAKCYNAAEMRMSELVDADLVNVRFATRLALAAKVDKGQMTEAESDLAFAQTISQLTSQLSARTTGRQIARAQTAAAIAAAYPPTPSPTTCTFIGNTMTCF